MRVLAISDDQFEDTELTKPVEALRGAGAEVDIAAIEAGTITGKKGTEVQANLAVAEVSEADYDMLFLPGGKAPERLRGSATVLDLARAFMASGKPIAAICHGPQILVSAGLVKGRTVTGYPGIGSELTAAGADYVDRELVTDGNLISSRQPGDLPVFIDQMLEAMRPAADPRGQYT